MKLMIISLPLFLLVSCGKHRDATDRWLEACLARLTAPVEEVTAIRCPNGAIENLSGIAKYKNLEELDLENNLITDISEVRNLRKLKKLFISGNPVSSHAVFKALSGMEAISLSPRDIEDIRTVTSNSSRTLEHFSIEGLDVTDEVISELAKLLNLSHLELALTGMDALPDLSSLDSLSWLSIIDETSLVDVSQIAWLADLEILSLYNTSVTNTEFFYDLPHLWSVAMWGIDNISVESLLALSELEHLSVYHSKFSGDVKLLVDMPSLYSIGLYNIQEFKCEDANVLQEAFGAIYFEGLDVDQCI